MKIERQDEKRVCGGPVMFNETALSLRSTVRRPIIIAVARNG